MKAHAKPTWDQIIPAIKKNKELQSDLNDFIDYWPSIEAYTPPSNVVESIRQIVILALVESEK